MINIETAIGCGMIGAVTSSLVSIWIPIESSYITCAIGTIVGMLLIVHGASQ